MNQNLKSAASRIALLALGLVDDLLLRHHHVAHPPATGPQLIGHGDDDGAGTGDDMIASATSSRILAPS